MDEQHDQHQSVLINHDTVASSPGRIKANPLKYSLHYPKNGLILLGVIAVSLFSGLQFASQSSILSFSIIIAAIAIVFCLRTYWNHIVAIAFHGDLCPCRVISVNPLRVAVCTNLSNCGQQYQVIKVINPPIRSLDGSPLKIGDQFASIAMYQASAEHEDRWADFFPKPVQCFTGDREQILNAVDRIPQRCWDDLDRGIEQIGSRSSVLGLHPFSW